MHEIGEKRRECKNISNFHCDGETRAKIGRFAAENRTFLSVIKPIHACTCIFSAIRITIVNR